MMDSPTVRIASPDTPELWDGYFACRVRNLYTPFGLAPATADNPLDHPRPHEGGRPEIAHRCAVEPTGAVVACGRIDLQPDHADGPSAQVRYCAVDQSQRGRGVAQLLLASLEAFALEHSIRRVWMDARIPAVGFYARAGYEDLGPGPTKYDLIEHRVMARTIDAAPPRPTA